MTKRPPSALTLILASFVLTASAIVAARHASPLPARAAPPPLAGAAAR